MKVRVAIHAGDELGEGPVWSLDEQALYWVDIKNCLLQRWDPETQIREKWLMPSEIGSFAICESGGFIIALRTGFVFWDRDSEEIKPLFDPENNKPYTRFNDGKCDRQGRFWAGTMDEESPNKRGSLYRLDPDLSSQSMIESIGISNGLGWSPDNQIFYYTDSLDHTIYAYEFNPQQGTISNKRVFATTPENYVPDGLTVDSLGYIWSANWDGWKIIRYAPNGDLDLEVPLPAQRPTSITFGGPDLNQIYITSARIGLNDTELNNQPLAGSVFVIDSKYQGIPEPLFKG